MMRLFSVKDDMKEVKYIVVHSSGSFDEKKFIDAEEIHKWHLRDKKPGIGYHIVILRSGAIEVGRPLYWAGDHTRQVNHCSWGVCLVGDRHYTDPQLASLRKVINDLKLRSPSAEVKGNYYFKGTQNEIGFNVENWWQGVWK